MHDPTQTPGDGSGSPASAGSNPESPYSGNRYKCRDCGRTITHAEAEGRFVTEGGRLTASCGCTRANDDGGTTPGADAIRSEAEAYPAFQAVRSSKPGPVVVPTPPANLPPAPKRPYTPPRRVRGLSSPQSRISRGMEVNLPPQRPSERGQCGATASKRRCDRCKARALPGERYCGRHREAVLGEMKDEGYLVRVPRRTTEADGTPTKGVRKPGRSSYEPPEECGRDERGNLLFPYGRALFNSIRTDPSCPENARKVDAILAALTPNQRAVAEDFFAANLPQAEIAKHRGKAKSTISETIRIVRDRFRAAGLPDPKNAGQRRQPTREEKKDEQYMRQLLSEHRRRDDLSPSDLAQLEACLVALTKRESGVTA